MFYKLPAVFNEDLIKASGSSKPLIPRIFECDRLLIVENSIGSIADSVSVNDVVGRKFDIFGKKESLPPASFFNNFDISEKSGARNSTTCVQVSARLRKEARLANKSCSITRRNSIAVKVFGVSVTCCDCKTLVINPVHSSKIIFV